MQRAYHKMKQRSFSLLGISQYFIATVVISLLASTADAGKVVLSAGAFSFSAENQSNRVSAAISGLGSYQMAYRHAMSDRVELDFGFSLVATETFGGDLAFGIDIGANYYVMTNSQPIGVESGLGNVVLSDRWRPFVGASFNQRNFQSTSSQYAGFGIKGGSEYQLTEEICLQGSVRYLLLGGPNQASATHLDMMGGLVFQF